MNNIDYDVLGIDLGTTNSCVTVWKNGQIEVVPNEMGIRITPSVVSFLNSETLIGKAAQKKISSNYQNTVYDFKRLIGRNIEDEEIKRDIENWPFVVNGDENGKPIIHVEKSEDGKLDYTPEDLSCMILKYLKRQADNFVGRPLTAAVITVPAYFTESQREATEEAARLAGLNVLRLLDEPSAAALTYSIDSTGEPRHIVVYDLGGGTFDCSILEVGHNRICVIASDGDRHLGGEDFVHNMMEYLFHAYRQRMNKDIRDDRLWRSRIRNAAEEAKIALSTHSSTDIEFENSDFSFAMSRSRFENMNNDLFRKTIAIVERTIEKANLKNSDISEIILVGGSTRIPCIQQMLQDSFPECTICKSVNPIEAVAKGAAIMAAVIQSQRLKEMPQQSLLSFGIEVQGGIVEVMIPRGTPLPAACTYEFVTPCDYQKTISFRITMGERPLARDCTVLGEVTIEELVLRQRGETTFSVTMSLSLDHHLEVVTMESSGQKRVIWDMNLDYTHPLSPLNKPPEVIDAIIRDSEIQRAVDADLVSRHQAMNALSCMVEDGYAFLHKNTPPMSSESLQQKKELLESIESWMYQNPDAGIQECQERQQLICNYLLEQTVSSNVFSTNKTMVAFHSAYNLIFFFSMISRIPLAQVGIRVPGP